MAELSQLVSEDSRTPIEKLRRCHLWKEADRRGIKYPPGATKITMIKLLEANGVDITQPLGDVKWMTVYPSPQAQRAAAMFGQAVGPQLVPVEPVHASARNGANPAMELDRRVREKESKREEAFEKSRLEALEKETKLLAEEKARADAERAKLAEENERLKQIIEQRLAALEQQKSAPVPVVTRGPNASQREYWKAYRHARDIGLPVQKGMTREQIEALIQGAGSQSGQ